MSVAVDKYMLYRYHTGMSNSPVFYETHRTPTEVVDRYSWVWMVFRHWCYRPTLKTRFCNVYPLQGPAYEVLDILWASRFEGGRPVWVRR